jgi:hypothetical protein
VISSYVGTGYSGTKQIVLQAHELFRVALNLISEIKYHRVSDAIHCTIVDPINNEQFSELDGSRLNERSIRGSSLRGKLKGLIACDSYRIECASSMGLIFDQSSRVMEYSHDFGMEWK